VEHLDIAVRGGTIVEIGDLHDVSAARTIDASDRYVLPGIIDVHNHPVYADDLAEMCAAGAAAGVTTVISFVGAFPSWGLPKTTPLEVIRAWIKRWEGGIACDFGVHAAIDAQDDLAADIAALVESGVTSFKFFMAYRERGMMIDDSALIQNFDLVASHGGIAMVHAENGAAISYLESRYGDADTVENGRYIECHSGLVEAEAVFRALALADAVGCPLYIPHLTVAEALDAVEIARRKSRAPIWVETCPHYLLLTNDEVVRRGSLSKIAPPLRERHDNDVLWRALERGDVHVIGSDHCGRTLEMKSQGNNILQAPYGAESIEHLLPLTFSEGVVNGRIDIRRLVQVLAESPADIFGLSPRKGRIAIGADADLVLLDPSARSTLSARDHVGTSDYCLYEGWECQGAVDMTIRRGLVSYDRESPTAGDSGGVFLARRGVTS
jgi:dihydropyrimidinase